MSDEEWNFCLPYLTLMKEDAPQREHSLREVLNGLRWLARTGSEWRMMPHDLRPGGPSIHKRGAGSRPDVLPRWWMICACYYGCWRAGSAAQEHGITLEVVKLSEAKKGFVLLPKRRVVERSFAWAARFRRLARDYERLSSRLAGYHWLAFALLMLKNFIAKSA